MTSQLRALRTMAVAVGLTVPAIANAQVAGTADTVKAPGPFYQGAAPVEFTLKLNMALVRADTMDDPPARDATISVRGTNGRTVDLPVKVRTRGRWRLTHCDFPPLNLNFDAGTESTPFAGLDKARLTNVCRNNNEYEQYLLQEMQLYRLYQQLTPYSQAARPVRITWVDSTNGKKLATRYGFFIEDRDEFAARTYSAVMKAEGAMASDLSPYHAAVMGVFEYMIGNTDFFLPALHNVMLLATAAGEIVPVAFDFDYSGAIGTPYAIPNPVLKITSVRDRLFRGPCASDEVFHRVFGLFVERRKAMERLYDDEAGKLIRWNLARDMLGYFDGFYRIIGDTAVARREIIDHCVK